MATSKIAALLQGKKVVILGGSSGIGLAVASALIEEGAHVIIGSSSTDRVNAAIAKLVDPEQQYNADKNRVEGYAVNLAGPTAEQSLREFFSKTGPFDHLIYTAGDALAAKPLGEWTYEDMIKAGNLRFFSAILAVKVATEDPNLLKQHAGGSIVLTTGTVADKPMPHWSIIAGFAAGTYGLTRNLALDLADKGIRVNAVSPGAVETELWAHFPEEVRNGLRESMSKELLTGKVGKPEEVATAYVYLLKDQNQTAQTIITDGGRTVATRS